MSDRRDDPHARRLPAAEREASLAELVDSAVRKIVTAIVIAGALIGAGTYWGGEEAPRYQVTAADGRIIRVNSDSGTVIACETSNGECAIILQRGQDLADELPERALPAPAPAAPKADNAAAPVPAAR